MWYNEGQWRHFTPDNSQVLYWTSNHLKADPEKGIWYLPHDDVLSSGLGYFDGITGKSYNPPHKYLHAPSSLVVDPHGSVWMGTWFDGLYKLKRN